jgi:hypothetical protein
MATGTIHELRVAEEIVNVLPGGSFMRVCSEERDVIRYAIRSNDLKLRTVVLSRASLRRLINDPAREVKIEYLQRDLLRSAKRRAAFQYPRPSCLARMLPSRAAAAAAAKARALAPAVASVL